MKIGDKIYEESMADVLGQINDWYHSHTFEEFYSYIASKVKGQEAVKLVVANVYSYLFCLIKGVQHNNNMILAAPTGCGKTETYRAIRDYFMEEIPDLPIVQIDLTFVTPQGYKGADTEFIISELFLKHETNGIGIIFLDEFDKKLVPSIGADSRDSNLEVQSQILTLIEGRKVYNKKNTICVDTSNTLFIGLGSFAEIRKNRETAKRGIGFGAKEMISVSQYDEITEGEILEMGGIEELIGRFPLLVNYHNLTDKIICEILDETIASIEKCTNYHIRLTSNKRKALCELANGRFGCRSLQKELRKEIMPIVAQQWQENEMEGTIVLDLKEIVDECEEELAG
ncbi:MAG: AAA family ATPase [Lachnospiraceae bacterium]